MRRCDNWHSEYACPIRHFSLPLVPLAERLRATAEGGGSGAPFSIPQKKVAEAKSDFFPLFLSLPTVASASLRPPSSSVFLFPFQQLKMSDTENMDEETTTTQPVAESSSKPAPTPEKMDVLTALKEVLKKALIHDGLARGLHECAKALDRRQAHLCALAANCDEPTYVKLVEALCLEHNINLIKVPDSKQLGEWAGLCQIDNEGLPRKVVSCSCVVVKDFGEDTEALRVLMEHFKTTKGA